MKNLNKYAIIIGIIGLAMFIALMIYAPGFAMFGEALIVVAAFIIIFWLFDKYVLKEIDTIDYLKQGDNYGLALLALALIFLAGVLLVR